MSVIYQEIAGDIESRKQGLNVVDNPALHQTEIDQVLHIYNPAFNNTHVSNEVKSTGYLFKTAVNQSPYFGSLFVHAQGPLLELMYHCDQKFERVIKGCLTYDEIISDVINNIQKYIPLHTRVFDLVEITVFASLFIIVIACVIVLHFMRLLILYQLNFILFFTSKI